MHAFVPKGMAPSTSAWHVRDQDTRAVLTRESCMSISMQLRFVLLAPYTRLPQRLVDRRPRALERANNRDKGNPAPRASSA
jgi:hypothetical protein